MAIPLKRTSSYVADATHARAFPAWHEDELASVLALGAISRGGVQSNPYGNMLPGLPPLPQELLVAFKPKSILKAGSRRKHAPPADGSMARLLPPPRTSRLKWDEVNSVPLQLGFAAVCRGIARARTQTSSV